MIKDVLKYIEKQKDTVIELQTKLTSIPAINPENGGNGEYDKFLILKDYINTLKFDSVEEIHVEDKRVTSKIRPSLIASINGKDSSKNFWIITHLDVVPPGETSLWDSDPFTATVKGDKIFGRGTEDNQQSLVSSILLAKALLQYNIKPKYNLKILFVADEEVGSEYGIQWILKNKNYFNKYDLILTPDGGNSEGKTIEVAEKSILWVNFIIKGKQAHGSRSYLGINAARASSFLCTRLEKLNVIYNHKDEMYDIPYSSFEPTKKRNNVTNFNTIPGEEELAFDCRILPNYNLEDIINSMKEIANTVEQDYNVKIITDIKLKLQAPAPTPNDAEIVKILQKSIKTVLNIDAKPIGIGGGTVAAYFRILGYQAALWSTIDTTMHSPNEYSKISNTINDAKVFADLVIAD